LGWPVRTLGLAQIPAGCGWARLWHMHRHHERWTMSRQQTRQYYSASIAQHSAARTGCRASSSFTLPGWMAVSCWGLLNVLSRCLCLLSAAVWRALSLMLNDCTQRSCRSCSLCCHVQRTAGSTLYHTQPPSSCSLDQNNLVTCKEPQLTAAVSDQRALFSDRSRRSCCHNTSHGPQGHTQGRPCNLGA
jgi:hypothetical protein